MTNVAPSMRTATRLLPLLMVSACALGGETDDPTFTSALSGTASIGLVGSSTRVSLTTDSEWSLSKTGSLSGNTVTWNITATKTATTSGHLVLEGTMTVTNAGSGPATIGNIVVNLQTRSSNSWATRSSDVANATQGDAATTAKIHAAASSENKSSFSENGASGSLNFMDATNNTVFSLVPQVMIGAGQTRTLLFTAAFNNNNAALQLTPGTGIRAEVIVTFGNATQNGNSTANVDINGNGVIDADENRVRSVPSRLGVTVPVAVAGNATVTLTDALSNITSTGDVTFSNAQFNLGATSGTVTVNVGGGTNGGAVTNCAHLTSPDQVVNSGGASFTIVAGVDLQACSTIEVAGSGGGCTPGAPGCGWSAGDMHTFPQSAYGDSTSLAGMTLAANFSSLYGSTTLVVGGANTLRFTTAPAVFTYLPATGAPGILTGSLTNPLTSSSGELGGQVLALQLNTDLSVSGSLTSATPLGSLYICHYGAVTQLNGQTVDELLATANSILGGGSATFGPGTATTVASLINNAFVDGTPSTFAQANLQSGPCVN